MAANKQPLEPLFKELDGFIQEEEYAKVIKTSDKILALSTNDPDALKCKVVAYIKLGQFPNALGVINGLDKKLASEFSFENAYCLYRGKQYDQALDVIQAIPKPYSTRVLELEAQVRYRLENYKQCITIYEDLLNNQQVDTAELKTNLVAAYTEAGMYKENLFFVEKNKAALQTTFELAFNAACAFIYSGDFVRAETYLQQAKKVCAESLAEDGYSAAEIQQELAVISVQMAYCQQLAGQLDQASALYAEVLKTKNADPVALAVATNNVIVSGKKEKENNFESSKKLRNATSSDVEQKLASSQRKVLSFNKALLTLQTGKSDQVRGVVEQLEKEKADPESLVLLKASLAVKEKQLSEAEKLLSEFSKKNPNSLRVPLSLAQIYLNRNDLALALGVLQGLSDEHKFKPNLMTTTISLYEKAGDIEGASKAYDRYSEWAEKKKDLDSDELSAILRLNGEFKLKHKKYEQAFEVFEKVVKKNRNDLKALAQVVIAASHFNPSLAKKYEERIPVPENTLNGEELEKLQAPSLRFANNKQVAAPAGEEKKQLKKDKKKKRKPRLPKKYDPNATPDPERWLPKWQRSYFKKRQKKGVIGKGSQGIALTGAAAQQGTSNLQATASPAKPQAAPAKPSPPAVPAGAKKKKGGRR